MKRWAIAGLLLTSTVAQAQTSNSSDKAAVSTHQTSSAGSGMWEIDAARSTLTFSLRHLLAHTEGHFDTWSGTITLPSNDWNKSTVDVTIKTASINTDNRGRDKHLRSNDFFDAETYPDITFKSTGVKREGDSIFVTGNLAMHGVTKPVVLRGRILGASSGEKAHMSFHATTVINRLDYGISYNRMVEAGGTLLGDDVTIETTVMAVPKSTP